MIQECVEILQLLLDPNRGADVDARDQVWAMRVGVSIIYSDVHVLAHNLKKCILNLRLK